jgi:hypothetical protein
MERHNIDFHVAEYSALRSELQFNIKSALEAVIYSLIANALIVAWIADLNPSKANISNFVLVASGLPIILTILAWAIFQQRIGAVSSMANYCRKLEFKFGLEGFGWQKFVADTRSSRIISTRYIYITIFIIQLILGVYVFASTFIVYYGV